jgi:hypothetical protein
MPGSGDLQDAVDPLKRPPFVWIQNFRVWSG